MAMEIKIENCESEISGEIFNVEKIENSSNDKAPVSTSLDITNSPKTFKCPMFNICSESFASVDLVNEHYILIHARPKKAVNQNWVWPAENQDLSDTPFVFNFSEDQNPQNLEKTKFLRKTPRKRPKFSCSDCPFVGKDKNDTSKHRHKVHLTEKRFKCSQCDYATNRSGNLAHHMVLHSQPKFNCEFCDYKCYRKAQFQAHMRKHTGEKPFKCNICDYASGKSNIRF